MRYQGKAWLYFRYVKSRKIGAAVVFAAICLLLSVISARALCFIFLERRKIDWRSCLAVVVPVALLEEALLLAVFARVKTDSRVYRFFRIVGIDLSRSPGIPAVDLYSVTVVPFLCNLAFSIVVFNSMRLSGLTISSIVIAELLAYVLSIYGFGRLRIRALKKDPAFSDIEYRAPKRVRFRPPILSRSLNIKLFWRAVRTDMNLLLYTIGFAAAFVFSIKTLFTLPPEAAFSGSLFGTTITLAFLYGMIQEYLSLINRNFFLLQPLSLGKFFIAALRPVLLLVMPVSLGWLLVLVFRAPQGLFASLLLFLFVPVIGFNIGVVCGNTLKSGLLSLGALALMVMACCVNVFLMLAFQAAFFVGSYTSASFHFKNYAWRK